MEGDSYWLPHNNLICLYVQGFDTLFSEVNEKLWKQRYELFQKRSKSKSWTKVIPTRMRIENVLNHTHSSRIYYLSSNKKIVFSLVLSSPCTIKVYLPVCPFIFKRSHYSWKDDDFGIRIADSLN